MEPYPHTMVTSVDLARQLGLSQTTVSRALRGHPSVTEKTRRRVIDAAQALGYRPDAAARMLVTRRAKALGVVVADLRSPLYPCGDRGDPGAVGGARLSDGPHPRP